MCRDMTPNLIFTKFGGLANLNNLINYDKFWLHHLSGFVLGMSENRLILFIIDFVPV
jgi:hypothetical protein